MSPTSQDRLAQAGVSSEQPGAGWGSRYQLATRRPPPGGGTLASQMRGVMPRLIAQNDPHPERLTQTHYSSIQPGALPWTTVRATSRDKVPVNHFPITHAELTQI